MQIVPPIPKNPASKAKFVKNKKKLFLCGNFTTLRRKFIQIWDHFFPLVFPKDSESLTSLDIGLKKVGAKRRLNGVNKGEKKSFFISFFAAAILDHFLAKMFKSETSSFQYFSPRISNLKNFWTSDFEKWGQKDV